MGGRRGRAPKRSDAAVLLGASGLSGGEVSSGALVTRQSSGRRHERPGVPTPGKGGAGDVAQVDIHPGACERLAFSFSREAAVPVVSYRLRGALVSSRRWVVEDFRHD